MSILVSLISVVQMGCLGRTEAAIRVRLLKDTPIGTDFEHVTQVVIMHKRLDPDYVEDYGAPIQNPENQYRESEPDEVPSRGV